MNTKIIFRSILIIVFFAFPRYCLLADGAKVTIILKSGDEITGEFLAIKESTIIIAKNLHINDKNLELDSLNVLPLNIKDISKIKIHGKSYLLDGMIIGTIAGISIGTLVSYDPRGWETFESNYDAYGPGFKGIILCASGGALLGALAGATAPAGDKEISIKNKYDLFSLKQYTRYKDNIPKFLERLVP